MSRSFSKQEREEIHKNLILACEGSWTKWDIKRRVWTNYAEYQAHEIWERTDKKS